MDRGIRIAIVAACILSIGLGLVWDSVIDVSREVIVGDSNGPDSMEPDPAQATIRGLREQLQNDATPIGNVSSDEASIGTISTSSSAVPGSIIVDADGPKPAPILTEDVATPAASGVSDLGVWANCPPDLWQHIDAENNTYIVQKGDIGYSVLCYRSHRFGFLKERFNLTTKDWIKANGGSDKLVVGKPIKIPVTVPMR